MDNIGQKLASSYWLKKVRGAFKVNEFSLKETKLIKETIDIDDLLYFSKLTNKKYLIEYTTLLSIFNALLCRYFDVENFIYSSKIGADNIPLLLSFNSIKENTFKEYLQKNKEEVQVVYKYSNYGREILEEYNFEKYATYGFIYNTNFDKKQTIPLLPFILSVKKEKKSLELELCYDNCFVSDHVAIHFLQMFKNWMCNLENLVDKCVENISIITDTEKNQLLQEFNDTEKEHSRDKTIVDLFENQVKNVPENIAVLFEEKKITYQELNERANQLANYLRLEHEINSGDLVGVKLDRNENLLIGIIGVLKTGAAYVPIDTHYPEQRINYIEKDSNAKIVIDKSFVKKFTKEKNKYATENLERVNKPDDVAYIIYTSGTTGNPKGVMISHANAVAMIHWSQQEFNKTSFNVVYAVTSHCFDLSVYEMFYPLSIGKTIRILNDALEIKSVLNNDTKVLINTVPSSMRNLLDDSIKIENISVINLAGESFPIDIANKLAKTRAQVRNLYGPSEDTTYSTVYKLNKNEEYSSSIPIGKPIANTRAYVLGKLKLQEGDRINYKELATKVSYLSETDNFIIINFTVKNTVSGKILVLNVKEKNLRASLRLGVHYDFVYKSSVLLNLNRKNILSKNDAVSIDLVVGDRPRFEVQYFVDNGFYYSYGFSTRYNSFQTNVTSNTPGINLIDLNYRDFTNRVYLQTTFERKFAIGLGLEHQKLLSDTETISTPTNKAFIFDDSDYFNMYSYLTLDTYDDKYYPTQGFFLDAKFKWYIASSDYNTDFVQFSQLKGKVGFAKALNSKTTFILESEAGFTLGNVSSRNFDFLLGGYNKNFINNFIPFYGYDINALVEQSFLKSTFNFRFNVTETQFILAVANYARVENSVLEGGDLFKNTKSGYALGYSLNSILGPIDLKYSWSPDTKNTYWYFNLGFWF